MPLVFIFCFVFYRYCFLSGLLKNVSGLCILVFKGLLIYDVLWSGSLRILIMKILQLIAWIIVINYKVNLISVTCEKKFTLI